jgi:hypothetical protein
MLLVKKSRVRCKKPIIGTTIRINEFTVAPQITPAVGPYHEWFIEFDRSIGRRNYVAFAEALDNAMRKQIMMI